MTDRGWPVYDPGAGGIADLYPYVVEIEYEITDLDVEPEAFGGPEEQTAIMPAARLVERCTTAAALRSRK